MYKTNRYPIAQLLRMSLSVGMGDSTGLRGTKRMLFHRICKALVSSASTHIVQVMTKIGVEIFRSLTIPFKLILEVIFN